MLPAASSVVLVATQHMCSIADTTALLLALEQLKEPWTKCRLELASRALIVKALSLQQKPDQKMSLSSVIQQYLKDFPSETVQCIIHAYDLSFQEPNSFSFFKNLYEACNTVPSFVSLLLQISRLPAMPNLCLLVHLLFLEKTHRNNMNIQNQLLLLYETTGTNLITVLIDMLKEYANKRYYVIDDPQLALIVTQFLKYLMTTYEVPPALKQSFVSVLSLMDPSLVMSNDVYQAKQWLNAWLSATSPDRMSHLINRLLAGNNSEEGQSIISTVEEQAFGLLKFVQDMPENELMNLIRLIEILAQNQLIPQENLLYIMQFECAAWKEELPRASVLFAQHLLNRIMPSLCLIPDFIPGLLNSAPIMQIPPLYNELKRGYAQFRKPSALDAGMVSPPMEVKEVSPALSPEEQEALKRRRAELVKDIEVIPVEPVVLNQDESVKNRVSILINNLTVMNIDQKTGELEALITPELEKWFVDYFVRSRVERQNNYHSLYVKLLSKLEASGRLSLVEEVLQKSIIVSKEIIHAEAKSFSDQHNLLRCMGEWLGLISIGRDVYLSQLHLNLTDELLIAFYHKRLLYVFEFVCYLLRGCKTSTVMHPPQPWLMALLSLLKELTMVPGISKVLGRVYKNMMDFVPFNDNDVKIRKSDLFLAIPEVANNPDFTSEASQNEVIAFFRQRYPREMEVLLDGDHHASFPQKTYHEFVPKTQANGQGPNAPGAPVSMEPQLMVTFGDEVKSLNPQQQAEMRSVFLEKMSEIVKSYNQGMGITHFQIATSSLHAMYVRDLLDVTSTADVLTCLEKAAKTVTESLLFTSLHLIEKGLLNQLFDVFRSVSALVPDTMIITVVKTNMPMLINVLLYRLRTSVMKNVKDIVTNDREMNPRNVNELGRSASRGKFLQLDGVTENERVDNGALNETQKNVYLKMVNVPALTEALMSEEELANTSVLANYQWIIDVIRRLFSSETPVFFWDTRFVQSKQINSTLQECNRLFKVIEGRHIASEDAKLISILISVIRNSSFSMNYHMMAEVVELAALFAANGVADVSSHITACALEALSTAEQRSSIVSLLLLLAGKGLLDVTQMDGFFMKVMRANSMINDMTRVLFLCFVDLVLTHEAVKVEELPLTMREIRAVAKKEEGKRLFRFENKMWSYENLLKALEEKATVIEQRNALAEVLKGESVVKLMKLFSDAIRAVKAKENVAEREEAFATFLTAFDSTLQTQSSVTAFAAMYAMLTTSLQTALAGYNTYYDCAAPDALARVFSMLVHREKDANHRVLAFKAEMECLQAFFYHSHDFNEPRFLPAFFLRLLIGLLKMVVIAELEEATRDELLFLFSSFLHATAPTNTPIFVTNWLQIVSMPQLLYMMINSKKPKLMALENEIVLSLLLYTPPLYSQDIKSISEVLLNRIVDFIHVLLVSFPGFMVRRASEYCQLVPEELRYDILYDCPLECNPAMARMGDESFLDKAWSTRIEPTMKYKQDLERVSLVDAAEKVMMSKDVGNNLQMIHRVIEMSDASPLITVRALVMFWVMEEKRIHDSVEGTVSVKLPEECLILFFDEMNVYPKLKVEVIVTLEDFIRFPCKETELFMNTFIGLYRRMDPDTQRLMMDGMYRRNKLYNGQLGIVMTLNNIQRN